MSLSGVQDGTAERQDAYVDGSASVRSYSPGLALYANPRIIGFPEFDLKFGRRRSVGDSCSTGTKQLWLGWAAFGLAGIGWNARPRCRRPTRPSSRESGVKRPQVSEQVIGPAFVDQLFRSLVTKDGYPLASPRSDSLATITNHQATIALAICNVACVAADTQIVVGNFHY